MNKKTIAIFAVCMVLVAALSVFTTLALLTSKSETVTNTFTSGNVKITLDEAKVDDEGREITGKGAERVANNSYNLYPGKIFDKDPTITNKGNETAFVGVVVTVKATKENDTTTIGAINTKGWTGTLLTNAVMGANIDTAKWTPVGDAVYTEEANTITYTYYYNEAIAKDDKAVLFTELNVSSALDNTDIELLNGISIVIDGYGVQEETFEGQPLAALKAGFSAQFGTPVQQS